MTIRMYSLRIQENICEEKTQASVPLNFSQTRHFYTQLLPRSLSQHRDYESPPPHNSLEYQEELRGLLDPRVAVKH